MNGIVRNTQSPVLIAELQKAGYVEMKEPVEISAPEVEPEKVEKPAKAGKAGK